MKYLIIKDKVIINIVDYVSNEYLADNTLEKIIKTKECYIGDMYDSETETVTPKPIPTKSYIELRLSEYPTIGDQLDMIYKDEINGTSNWTNLITSIKQKYPKPS